MNSPDFFVSMMHHISCIIAGLTATAFYLRILTPKDNIPHIRLLCYIFAFIPMFGIALVFDNYTLASTLGFIIGLSGPVFILFKQKISSKICAYMSACFMYFFSEVILSQCYLTINLFIPEKALDIRTLATSGYITVTLFNYVCVNIIFFILCHIIASSFQKYFRYIQLRTLAFLGLPLLILIANCNIVDNAADSSFIFYLIIFILLFIISLFFFSRSFSLLQKQEFERLKNTNLKIELSLQLEHHENIYKKFVEQRKWAHDLSNHLETIQYMIKHNEFDDAKAYIQDVINHTETMFHKAD